MRYWRGSSLLFSHAKYCIGLDFNPKFVDFCKSNVPDELKNKVKFISGDAQNLSTILQDANQVPPEWVADTIKGGRVRRQYSGHHAAYSKGQRVSADENRSRRRWGVLRRILERKYLWRCRATFLPQKPAALRNVQGRFDQS